MTGFVYFIRCQDRVKIGFSQDPARRLTNINSAAPFRCEMIGFVSAETFPERDLHERFADFRVHGEWFLAAASVLAFIADNSLCAPIRPDRADRAAAASASLLKRWRHEQGINQDDAADRIGITRVLWCRWEIGTSRVTDSRVLDVERITGISRHDLRPDIFGFAEAAPVKNGEGA